MQLSRRFFLRGIGSLFAGSFLTSSYALAVEPQRLRTQYYKLTPENWPPGLKLKIAVLADIHACRPWMSAQRIRYIAEAANALAPDVTVLLGDYIASHGWKTSAVPTHEWAEALAILKAPLGVYSVLGNHDWWEDRHAQQRKKGPISAHIALEKVNIPVLENDVVRLQKDKQTFWIAGLGDQLAFYSRDKYGRRHFEGVDDLPLTLAKVTDKNPVILLAHEPDIFAEVPDRVSLTLSGHTHGGQIRLFGYAPILPSRYGYAYGHIREKDAKSKRQKHLIVSGGLGCSVLPIRFGMPPEIVLVELGGSDNPLQNPRTS